ncbi:MAG: Flp pilus assembly protein CpaB [Alphaproteobacteria bacterium]
MRYQGFLKVVIATVVGIAIGGGAVFYLTTPREIAIPQAVTGPETVKLLVAKQALGYGATLQPENLKWVEWSKSAVPSGAFTSVEDLLGEKGDQRRIVLRPIEPGEPILESMITKPSKSPRMSMNLGAGMRAATISVDAVSGVAGSIAAGDRVDIRLTRTQEGRRVSSVILQDITVIAIDQSDDAEPSSPHLGLMVTVEVDIDQAQKLALAQQVGKLSPSRRSIGEPPRLLPNPNDDIRAFSIRIGIAGRGRFGGPRSIAAGDQVDIRLTRTRAGRRVTRVILQNITVISAGSDVATVKVDTAQAQRLELAQQDGKLSVSPVDECPHFSRCSWLRPL